MKTIVEAYCCVDCENLVKKKYTRCRLCSLRCEKESKEPWEKWVEANSFPKQMRLFKC